MSYFVFFFFVKQKTAYEMRISDWSSDVCSSDLLHIVLFRGQHIVFDRVAHLERAFLRRAGGQAELDRNPPLVLVGQKAARQAVKEQDEQCDGERVDRQEQPFAIRSEEHTSELQSLMRISYAVFCLKKKKDKNNENR